MTLRRLEGGGFELSGGPLRFRNEKDLQDTCIQMLRYPRMMFCQEGKEPVLLNSPMTIDDEWRENAEPTAKPPRA